MTSREEVLQQILQDVISIQLLPLPLLEGVRNHLHEYISEIQTILILKQQEKSRRHKESRYVDYFSE